MSTTTTTVEAYLGATQFLVTQIAKFHPAGGVIAAATSSYLLGEVSLAARVTDLAVKLQDGTATGEDVAQVFSSTASVLAGCNTLMVGVTPLAAGLLTGAGAAAGVLYLYQTFVPQETKQAVWEGMFKTIFESPFYEPHSWNEMQGIAPATATSFLAARTVAPIRRDPLILDLDGDGLETIGINPAAPILFDHDGDGVKTATGWIGSDDAFLVLDRNGNNAIDNGSELFGDATPLYAGGLAADGFAALGQEDSNHDGKVDGLDARFASLCLWRDLNQDGISQSGELFTLASQGIAALNVARTANATLLANGNQIADLGGFVRRNGTGGTLGAVEQLADINLASSPFYSQFTDSIPLTEATMDLADMQGAGMVRSLRQAASLQSPQGSALAAQLAAFGADTTRSGQSARLEPLLKAWSDTSTMATTATGAFAGVNLSVSFAGVANGSPAYQTWLDKLSILERFNGQTFLPVPAGGTTLAIDFHASREAALDAAYAALKDSVYCGLVMQTRLKPYLDDIGLSIGEGGIALDYAAMTARLDTLKATDGKAAAMDLVDLQRFAGGQLVGWMGLSLLGDWVNDPAGSADVTAALVEMRLAHGGNDAVLGFVGNDKSRRWWDGERNAFCPAANNTMFAIGRVG